MTGCERILDRLRQGPASAQELYALGTVAHSRISDLRSRGYEIECELTDGLYIYTLSGSRGPSSVTGSAPLLREGAAENSGTSARAPLPVRDPGLDELERPLSPLPLVGEGQLDIFAEVAA